MTDATDAARVASRYGKQPPKTAISLLVILGVVIVALIIWLVWAIGVHSSPKVSSGLSTWETDNDNQVTVTVEVQLHDEKAQDVQCKVAALAEDHTTVGFATFTPITGRQSIALRTDRLATSVDWKGCTAKGQNEPR